MPKKKDARSNSLSPVRSQQSMRQLKALFFPSKLRRPMKLNEDHIHSVLLVRRARASVFGTDLFSDPAWDIILELYAAKLGARATLASDLCRATDAPASTTMRWIAVLENRGLVTTEATATEPAKLFVNLTADGASRMEHLADHWGGAFVSI